MGGTFHSAAQDAHGVTSLCLVGDMFVRLQAWTAGSRQTQGTLRLLGRTVVIAALEWASRSRL